MTQFQPCNVCELAHPDGAYCIGALKQRIAALEAALRAILTGARPSQCYRVVNGTRHNDLYVGQELLTAAVAALENNERRQTDQSEP